MLYDVHRQGAAVAWRVEKRRTVVGRLQPLAACLGTAGGVAFVLICADVNGSRLSAATSPTFNQDVAPIVFSRCAPCHRPGGPAPFSLLTYDEVRRHATQIARATKSRFMPPWKPEPGFGDFEGARRLTDREIGIFEQWSKHGAGEGAAVAAPPLPHWTPGWQLGSPDLVLTLPEYILPADGRDAFRNFVVHIPGSGTRFVRGLEFRAGNGAIHHANIRIDPTSASRRLDEADPEPGYEGLILNSAEYPDGHFLGWTPGQVVPFAPRGLALRLTGGADFVVQLHMRPSGKPERIQPALGLFFTDEAPTLTPAMLRLGRQNIDIPPNESRYHSTDSYTLPVDAQVQAVQPHSHYRALSVNAWAVLPDGSRRPLIYIPRWDFAWQDAYRYTTPFWLPAGTRLFTEYLFDNSADNPKNPEAPPKRALWGSRSSDEMADVWIQVLTRNDKDRGRLVADFRRKADAEDIVGYETRIRAEPDYAALHADVAVLYVELGQPERAVPHFGAVVRLQPGSAVARYNLGTALEGAGRFSDAAEQYSRAIELDGSYAPAHVNLGNMLLRAGNMVDAQAQYREALRLNAANADAHNNLGRVLLRLGRRREAEAEILEALRLRPAYAEAHFNMAEMLRDVGESGKAVEHYRQALAVRPDWPPCLTRLSWTLSTDPDAAVRNPDEAIRLAARAVEATRRTDAAAMDALAAAYASAGRFDAAVSAASDAASLAVENAEQAGEIRDRLALYRRHLPYVEEKR